jgi:hypothetical protein
MINKTEKEGSETYGGTRTYLSPETILNGNQ